MALPYSNFFDELRKTIFFSRSRSSKSLILVRIESAYVTSY